MNFYDPVDWEVAQSALGACCTHSPACSYSYLNFGAVAGQHIHRRDYHSFGSFDDVGNYYSQHHLGGAFVLEGHPTFAGVKAALEQPSSLGSSILCRALYFMKKTEFISNHED